VIGAREFARVLADRFANSPVPPPTRYEVDEKIRDRLPDKTWSSFSALITKRKDDPSATLELHYLQTWGLAILHENSDLQVEVRLPDGRDVALPTRVLSSGFAEADASALPLADRDIVLRIQLGARSGNVGQPLSIPLAYYSWSKERHEPAFYARRTTATVQPEKTVYSALEPVRVKWSGIKEPSRLDWVGIFPAGDERALRRTFKVTGGASSGEMEMQPMFYPGKYDLRLFRDNNWDLLATSEPFEVVAMAGSLAISQASIAAGSTFRRRPSPVSTRSGSTARVAGRCCPRSP
jgi:hypothetical protein